MFPTNQWRCNKIIRGYEDKMSKFKRNKLTFSSLSSKQTALLHPNSESCLLSDWCTNIILVILFSKSWIYGEIQWCHKSWCSISSPRWKTFLQSFYMFRIASCMCSQTLGDSKVFMKQNFKGSLKKILTESLYINILFWNATFFELFLKNSRLTAVLLVLAAA